jgi:N-methylhydantoinase A/oxoprolinase/acetone carboxylase beta subunit
MDLGIGIDTGGTFTDGVIIDLASGQVLAKAKATTTRHDLRQGIGNALQGLDPSLFPRVRLVSLSTTLATNNIVEGKGARVGLITAVPRPATFAYSQGIPCEEAAVIAGAHDHRGRCATELDLDTARAAIERMADKVDAFAVSGYFSIYNARHELQLKELIGQSCSSPVVCGHELTTAVGMVERAVTAVLNARLLSVIRELLDAVTQMLIENRIVAPLLVVKGDGSLISAEAAGDRPVETILSGPAASIAGACRLSGLEEAIVVDMGGTTTDIAIVRGGGSPVKDDGAVVGGWQTRVRAVDMWTIGLGGDSRIVVRESKIHVGPRRAIPLCAEATAAPLFSRTLRDLDGKGNSSRSVLDFFTLIKRPSSPSRAERTLFDLLDGQVLHRDRIAEAIGPYIDLDRLVALGVLAEVALTPTDLLHAQGRLDLWDQDAAERGVELLAHQAGLSRAAFLEQAMKEITAGLSLQLTAKTLHEYEPLAHSWSCDNLDFLNHLLQLPASAGVGMEVRLGRPIIAVGAPVKAFLPEVADRLGTRLIIPEHAEVANAFGAITGRVVARADATIRPDRTDGFHLITSDAQRHFTTLEEALACGEELARETARRRAEESGGRLIEISVIREETETPLPGGWGDRVLLEIKLTATACGLPAY